ncbi:pyruvate/2-oxoglutarate dehydrogenase complex dihydrolipoamide dehydrogenase (E3) component [Phyllobacterium ifriqiyense]|uniref:Pyruvate/2-oxoglutarate dehydrogenase complex dihydrolipoamide dehydrogenase (E3) component n=1 Tax=Phyllobacterium ifriqiyense TaxID=314238 RepID=A0ABU0SBA9_9HYPH|nr:FAD-containing oxidoreductase [Phyllobacterium ifriqiyense]MDQ0998026.1 pyruvate/2-oxoglutarate dehydrogenase complex dihydrolipoamide dehydrogenase (E3) component [Phyllobacterium ifriqiyense]
MSNSFDAIIIGAGQAGPALAGRLTSAGRKVLLIERKLFGGTCVNTGCMPTKALVASAYAAHLARRGADFGVTIDTPIRINMKRIWQRADTVSSTARNNIESWLKGMDNCTIVQGHAKFIGPHEIVVGGETYTAPQIFINTGGRAVIPDMPGIDEIDYLTNTGILQLDTLPEHLVVIGGSYIGLEFAQMYRRFGAKVTIVEKGPRLVSREDEDVSEAIRQIIEAEGIECRLNAECISFKRHAKGAQVSVDCSSGAPAIVGSHVLLAIGRLPNTDDLDVEKAGIEMDERGYIKVHDDLSTSADGIWALGDCNGRGAFTHTSYNDFEIVAANLLDGEDRKVSARIPGYALYIDPPLGRVGLNETQARKSGRPLLISKRPMTRVGRAIEKDETKGFMKVIVDAETKKILGAAILGTGGDEAIHGILDMMNADVDYGKLQWAVPIHPTVSELIPTLLGDLKPVDN